MLLLQGVFRSGTTALFRVLRRDERLRCFYEPLHPNVLHRAREAHDARPDHPKSSPYAEYAPLLDQLKPKLDSALPDWPHWLDADDEAPTLATYLRRLADVDAAPLLQFNRAFWMGGWLARTFPEASFVHLVRDPRSVVWSQLTTASGDRVRMDWPIVGRRLPFSSGALRRVFSEHAYFGAYHLDEYFEAGVRCLDDGPDDDALTSALRRLDAVREAPPYVKALALWGRRSKYATTTRSPRSGHGFCGSDTRTSATSRVSTSGRSTPSRIAPFPVRFASTPGAPSTPADGGAGRTFRRPNSTSARALSRRRLRA